MTAILTRTSPAFVPYASRKKWAFCGDSITVGNTSVLRGGFRLRAVSLLELYYGYVPNVVGADYANSFSYPCMGAPGITSAQLHTTYTSIEAPIYTPEYATVLIGSNDAATGVATNTYVANVGLVLDDLRSANATVRVICFNCPDRTGFTTEINAYNVALQTAVLARADYLSGLVKFYDINTELGSAAGVNFGDGIHPNQNLGYPIVGDAAYNTFLTFIP